MRNYRPESYGEGFADVYDEWYQGLSNTAETAPFLERVAGREGPLRILELAVGTGRLALPLAERGHDVTGIDVSEPMIAKLRAADPDGRVTALVGDMVDDVPPGPFDVVLVAYTSLFLLTDPARQAACFRAVAAALAPDGCFVVEAFVPFDPPRPGADISLRSMAADRVVLSVSTTDVEAQRVDGQYVDLVNGEPVRLRPYSIRYSTPDELDAFAAAAGLELAERRGSFGNERFDPVNSAFHVSVYRMAETR